MSIVFFLFPLLTFAEDRIVVTATRFSTSANDLPASIEVISGEEWDRKGGQAENALSGVTGLTVTPTGGPGQTRSLLLRGSDSSQTLVLVNGIPVNDPLQIGRSFDFGQIPINEIDHVEVIKGPQSILYGSNAMGGVVQIFSKKASSQARARVEGGSYGTGRAHFSVNGFRAAYERTDGISARDSREGNHERDEHRAWTVGGTQEFPIHEKLALRVHAQYRDAKTDLDTFSGDALGTYVQNRQMLFRQEAIYLPRENIEWRSAASYSAFERDYHEATPTYYEAQIVKAETMVRKSFSVHQLSAGAELWRDSGRSSEITGRRQFQSGGFYLYDQLAWKRLQLSLGARVDIHNEHGTAVTEGYGLGLWLLPQTFRVKGNLGSAFKAPSLYQTYSAYGSQALLPERSRGWDAGLHFVNGPWESELVWYENRFHDLIGFNTTTNKYYNVNAALTYGLEWSLRAPLGPLGLRNALTTTRAVDRTTGQHLLRRPQLSNTLELSYEKAARYGGGLSFRYVGKRDDSHPLQGAVKMPTFLVINADAFYQLREGTKLRARGENLGNRHYQEVAGYGTPGLSGYLGLETDL